MEEGGAEVRAEEEGVVLGKGGFLSEGEGEVIDAGEVGVLGGECGVEEGEGREIKLDLGYGFVKGEAFGIEFWDRLSEEGF